jgi:hypothetical protein
VDSDVEEDTLHYHCSLAEEEEDDEDSGRPGDVLEEQEGDVHMEGKHDVVEEEVHDTDLEMHIHWFSEKGVLCQSLVASRV